MTASEIADRLEAKKSASGWEARCPAHHDRNASLGIAEGADGRVLLKCHAGCTFADITSRLGVKPAELMGKATKAKPDKQRGRIVKTYDYMDEKGDLVFQVVRYEPKDFKQRHPDPAIPGGWTWKMQGIQRVLYRLPEVLKAKAANHAVFLVEGEKDADNLASLGLCATCNPGGAVSENKGTPGKLSKWEPAFTSTLTGAKVIIIPDRDSPGMVHAQLVAKELSGKAASVRIVELPAEMEGRQIKDASDWLAAGGTPPELAELVRTAPAWTPPAESAPTAPASGLMNAASDCDEIRSNLWAITKEKLTAVDAQRKMAGAVVDWLHRRGRFYFHADRRDFAGVLYFDGVRKLLLPVQGDAFLAWLSDKLALNRSEKVFSFVQSAVETEGLSDRAAGILPATYWAATGHACYLSNGPGQMVRVSADSVALVDNGTDGVLFPYGSTLTPWKLTDPADPFEACSLFSGMSCAAPHGRLLFKLWACSLPTDQRTKPPLCVSGTVGSGKTRVVRGLFELYGMPERISAVTKNGEGDFWAAVDGGGLSCFDNADTRIDWLPDALAAAATAGTLEKRRLYTDADRVCLRARSAVAITSANPAFAGDAGLADRLLVVRLNRRTGATSEADLSDQIARNRDAGLSWICWTLADVLADTGATPGGLNARHPDFARFAVRLGRAMGREADAIAALGAAESDKGLFNLENDPIGAALLEVLQSGPFFGTAGDLRDAVIRTDTAFEGKLSAQRLSKRLAKLWPHLQSVCKAMVEKDAHTKIMSYKMDPPEGFAGFAGYQTAFSEKSPTRASEGTFAKTPIYNPHDPQTLAADSLTLVGVDL